MLIFNNTNDLIALLLDSFRKLKSIFHIVHYNDVMPKFARSIKNNRFLVWSVLFFKLWMIPITLTSQDHCNIEKQVKIDMLKNGCQGHSTWIIQQRHINYIYSWAEMTNENGEG